MMGPIGAPPGRAASVNLLGRVAVKGYPAFLHSNAVRHSLLARTSPTIPINTSMTSHTAMTACASMGVSYLEAART